MLLQKPHLGHRVEPKALSEKHWAFGVHMLPNLPIRYAASSDLRPYTSPRHDQVASNSCAAQSFIKTVEILRIKKFGFAAHVDLSRLMSYFLARELMDPPETDMDEGSYISGNAEAARRFGLCREEQWPFDLAKVCAAPPWRAMRSAYKNRIAGWTRLQTAGNRRVDEAILSLANGMPIPYGTVVGSKWFDYGPKSEPLGVQSDVEGRHATVLVGWDAQKQYFIGENSWSERWGDDGFYYIRPEVITDRRSTDFTCVTFNAEFIHA